MNKVAVITGGAGGMGYAIASVFGNQGYKLLLCDVKEESLENCSAMLKKQNMSVEYKVVDLGDEAAVKEAAKHAESMGEIERVVNTAGLSPILVSKMSPEDGIKAILNANVLGTIHVVESFYPLLKEGASMVLFTSSAIKMMPMVPDEMKNAFYSVKEGKEKVMGALGAMATDTGRAYMFSKMFVYYYTRMNAGRFGHKGCRINSISPGRVVTPMHQALIDMEPERIKEEMATMPLGRYGSAYEIANLADFLCSYRASYINGIDVLMDDGTDAFTTTPQFDD